jgi:hypothetical protein
MGPRTPYRLTYSPTMRYKSILTIIIDENRPLLLYISHQRPISHFTDCRQNMIDILAHSY